MSGSKDLAKAANSSIALVASRLRPGGSDRQVRLAVSASAGPASIPQELEEKSAGLETSRPPVRVLELRSVTGTGGGPDKTILLGAARSDPSRYRVTVAYLRDARDPSFGVADRAMGLGIDYTEVVERHSADLSVLGDLRALVRDRMIDIVHSHDYKTDLFALVLSWLEGVVPLSTTHGFSGHSWRERRVYYPLDRQLLRGFPCVIAVSSDIGERLTAAGVARERIRVILNGIDHQVFRRSESLRAAARARLGLESDEFAIGAIGRLEHEKRYDLLIDAFLRVASSHPRARLLIAGEGSLRATLQSTAMRSIGPDRIRFLGHCPDVIGLHHALDLFVQSSSNEGTPNAVLEAMALETPVVATAVGGTSELVRDTVDGLLVPSGDIAALAAAIELCLEAPAPLRTRTLAARTRVERELSFDTRQAKLEEVYEGLLQGRTARATRDR